MGKLKIPLDEFIETYIDITSELLKNELLLDSYDESVRKNLSNKFNLSEQDILHIHHSFHWTFFCDKNGSPFGYSYNRKKGELRVKLIKEVSLEEKLQVKKYILDKYKEYLAGRAKEVNILFQ